MLSIYMYVIDMFIYKYGHQVFYSKINFMFIILVECHDILELDK